MEEVVAMEVEVSTDVEHVMGKLLSDVEEGTVESNTDDESGTTNSSADPITSTATNGETESKPRPTLDPKVTDPIVIDLEDDDDEMEYSKENIQKAPEKSLVGLVKNLSAEATADLLGKIRIAVSKLPREALEDMYCKKLEEFVELNKYIRNLEIKGTHYNIYKDKVIAKAFNLQRQVVDLSKSMKNVTSNIARNPKYAQQAVTPIKFFRAVGVQVRNEPVPRKAPLANSKVMNTPPPLALASAVKSDTQNQNQTASNGVTLSSQAQKRLNQPKVSVGDLINKVQPEPPAKVGRRAGPASARLGANQKPQTSPGTANGVITNGTAAKPVPASNGLIDLTAEKSNGKGLLVSQNGVTYQVNATAMPQSVQIGDKRFQIFQAQGNGPQRPVFLQQQTATRSGSPGQIVARQAVVRPQNIILRNNVSPLRAGGTPMRPVLSVPAQRQISPAARLTNNVQFGRGSPSATVPTAVPYSIVLTKFLLPELPPPSELPKKAKDPPPRPTLTLQEQGGGIVLSWTHIMNSTFAEVQSYQIFACQEPVSNPTNTVGKTQPVPQWKRVGDVKALPLPMACTLSQFTEENRYHFIVRAVDVYNRTGPFCEVMNILLKKKGTK